MLVRGHEPRDRPRPAHLLGTRAPSGPIPLKRDCRWADGPIGLRFGNHRLKSPNHGKLQAPARHLLHAARAASARGGDGGLQRGRGAGRDGLGRLPALDRDPGRAGRLRGAARRRHGRDRPLARARDAGAAGARDAQPLGPRPPGEGRRAQRVLLRARTTCSPARAPAPFDAVPIRPGDDRRQAASDGWSSTSRSTTRSVERLGSRAALDDGDHFAFVVERSRDRPSTIKGRLAVPHQQPALRHCRRG